MIQSSAVLTVCVVETGKPKYVAPSIIKLADTKDVNIPNMTISGSSSYCSTLNIFPRTVLATDAPRNRTPQNSQIDATITACFSVILFDATDVAKAFATSFAPMAKQ